MLKTLNKLKRSFILHTWMEKKYFKNKFSIDNVSKRDFFKFQTIRQA